jgi:hypothetical protein
MYVENLSDTERDYSYYLHALVEDYEECLPENIDYCKSVLVYNLSMIHTRLYDESMGAPQLIIKPYLDTLLKYRIAKETLSALRPAVANAIQNTLDILEGTITDYAAESIAERIVRKGIIAMRNIL